MANPYYNASGTPATGSPEASAPLRSEFAAISAAFSMLPAPLAGRGGAFVIVNSTGTALATSLPSVVFGSPGPIGAKTPSTGNFTTLTAIGEVLAGSLAVLGISLGEFPQQVTIETGLPIPSAARPVGSIYIRKDGGIGTTLYISRGAGTWRAVAGV